MVEALVPDPRRQQRRCNRHSAVGLSQLHSKEFEYACHYSHAGRRMEAGRGMARPLVIAQERFSRAQAAESALPGPLVTQVMSLAPLPRKRTPPPLGDWGPSMSLSRRLSLFSSRERGKKKKDKSKILVLLLQLYTLKRGYSCILPHKLKYTSVPR